MSLTLIQRPLDDLPTTSAPPPKPARPYAMQRSGRLDLGQILLEMNAVDPGDLAKAVAMRRHEDARLGDILLAHGWVSDSDLFSALSQQWSAQVADLGAHPADPRLIDRLGPEFCVNEGVVPWRMIGTVTVIATSQPERFTQFCDRLPSDFGPVMMALASTRDVHAALLNARSSSLARLAESRPPADQSCRTLTALPAARWAILPVFLAVAGTLMYPRLAFALVSVTAITSLFLLTALKLCAFLSSMQVVRTGPDSIRNRQFGPLTMVSVIVPLYRETNIAAKLLERLGRITYPKELLDVVLAVEESDSQTITELSRARLPRWIRIITVPAGPIQTKPRALNYALDFCRGSIIGVWDAEDAPAADQIFQVVRHFHRAGPDVACLQGILDYYDVRHNWLSRCFAIEYAALFRVILPGLARLRLVVPLGGTTLFFRRDILEKLGRWDAHNVTEDADLGVRLARYGYRTELIHTVTEEEPNCRPLPWVRQRSRWLKGFAMTWACHMRNPKRLWRDLGARRFVGVQIFFIGTLSQFLLAPVLWSFWLLLFDLPHPLRTVFPPQVIAGLSLLFVTSELINITIALSAVRGRSHRHLMKWVPTMPLYFTLATAAAYKAIYECAMRPFYWDKTAHGIVLPQQGAAPVEPPYLLTNPLHIDRLGNLPAQPLRVENAPAEQPDQMHVLAPIEETGASAPTDSFARAKTAAPRLPHAMGSTFATASRRPRIELQPCLEGLGDM